MYCRDGAFVVLVYWFRLTWSRIAAATSDSFGPDVFVVCFVGFILLFPRFLVFLLFCFRSRSVLFRQLLLIFYVCELWGFLAMHIIVNTCERAHTHTQEWRERESIWLLFFSFYLFLCLLHLLRKTEGKFFHGHLHFRERKAHRILYTTTTEKQLNAVKDAFISLFYSFIGDVARVYRK